MVRSLVESVRLVTKVIKDIRTDYETTCSYKKKHAQVDTSSQGIPKMLITNVGFQSLAVIRCMHLARDLSFPFGAQLLSRLIRHVYGMEIHWQARIDPGVYLVHGNGIVISEQASVSTGCILMHNVTLGVSRDPETHATGAPQLGPNVHIGPGASLLGPIEIGEGTKVMAGAVLNHSVPPFSLVKPAEAVVTKRFTTKVS